MAERRGKRVGAYAGLKQLGQASAVPASPGDAVLERVHGETHLPLQVADLVGARPADGRLQGLLGVVLQKLQVPAAVIEGIEDYWRGMLSLPPETLGDTLLLADVLAPVTHPLRWQDPAQPPATRLASIDMLVGEDTLQEILHESAAEVAQLIETLKF